MLNAPPSPACGWLAPQFDYVYTEAFRVVPPYKFEFGTGMLPLFLACWPGAMLSCSIAKLGDWARPGVLQTIVQA